MESGDVPKSCFKLIILSVKLSSYKLRLMTAMSLLRYDHLQN